MLRGELYRTEVTTPADPRRFRAYLIVSRPAFLASRYQSAICVPVYSTRGGLDTEVAVGVESGLAHDSALRCDEVTSVPRTALRTYLGSLTPDKLAEVDRALAIAVGIDHLLAFP